MNRVDVCAVADIPEGGALRVMVRAARVEGAS